MTGAKQRHFLKYCIGSADTLGLDRTVSSRLQQALAADQALPGVIWLNGTACRGCTGCLANLDSPGRPSGIADLLVNYISLESRPNLETAAGDLAAQALNQAIAKDFILAVDGGIPTSFGGQSSVLWTEKGREVTAREVLCTLASRARAIVTIGNCASFGGTPLGTPNLTGIHSVGTATGRPTVIVPGCPAHPDWVVWTVAQLLANGSPFVDRNGGPAETFRKDVGLDTRPFMPEDRTRPFFQGEAG
ncbi:MAG: hypothetical protein AB1512_31530 [Thermodesulfobacteriota bacterium]